MPERLIVAVPLHQPVFPGRVHVVEPLTVAGGYVVVLVWLVQPVCPLEQFSWLSFKSVIVQDMPEPQVPGQDVPHAVGARLK